MIELRWSPLAVIAVTCFVVVVGFLLWIAEAGGGPMAALALGAAAVVAEGLWFRASVVADGVVVRSFLGNRWFRWDEGLKATLRAREGAARAAVEAVPDAEEVVLWTPDGRQRSFPRSLEGYESLVAELKRRQVLTTEAPPPSWADRAVIGLAAAVQLAWVAVAFTVLVGLAVGLGFYAVRDLGFSASGTDGLDVALIAVPALAAWLALSFAIDVGFGDDLLSDPATWASTGAAMVLGGGLLGVAAFHPDRSLAAFLGVAGLMVVATVLAQRIRRAP